MMNPSQILLVNLTVALFASSANIVAAPDLPKSSSDEQVQQIVTATRAQFWGHAVGMDGKVLQPADEQERASLLIPAEQANRVVAEAFAYGLAKWCGVAWKQIYLHYMQVERRKSWNVKQVAFIGMLFGMTQGTIERSMGRSCTPDERKESMKWMRKEKRRIENLLR